ncbi:MAG: PsbP-related protein [Patescibacteria group bacterium]
MDQNLPDFPSIDVPDFGGTGAAGTQPQNTPQGGQPASTTSGAPAGAASGSDGFSGGTAAGLGGVPELASLDGGGGSDKKKTTMIIVGGVAALVISVVFVGLYFYFQGAATSSSDDLLVPRQPQTQQQPGTQPGSARPGGETASPSADTQDPVASAPARPKSTPEPTVEPEEYRGEYFTAEMPGNWEIEEKTARGIYVEEIDVNIFTTVADEEIRVGIIKIQVSDELIANKFDDDKYEVLDEQEISLDKQPAELIEYQVADSEEANPITNVLAYHNDMTYRISFTANKNYDQADELRNEFLKMLISFTFPEKEEQTEDDASDASEEPGADTDSEVEQTTDTEDSDDSKEADSTE